MFSLPLSETDTLAEAARKKVQQIEDKSQAKDLEVVEPTTEDKPQTKVLEVVEPTEEPKEANK